MQIEYNNLYIHFLVSLNPKIDTEGLATAIADSSEKFINELLISKKIR